MQRYNFFRSALLQRIFPGTAMDSTAPLNRRSLTKFLGDTRLKVFKNGSQFGPMAIRTYFEVFAVHLRPIQPTKGLVTTYGHQRIAAAVAAKSNHFWSDQEVGAIVDACGAAGLTMREFLVATLDTKSFYDFLPFLRNTEDPDYYPLVAEWHESWKEGNPSDWGKFRGLLETFQVQIAEWINCYPGACPELGEQRIDLFEWLTALFVGRKFRPFFNFVRNSSEFCLTLRREFNSEFEKLDVYPYLMGPGKPEALRYQKPPKVLVQTPQPLKLEIPTSTWLDTVTSFVADGFFFPDQTQEERESTVCSVLDDPEVNAALKEKFPWLYRDATLILSSLVKREPHFWAELVIALYEYAEARLLKRSNSLFPQTPQKLRQMFERLSCTMLQTCSVEQLVIYDPLMSPADTQAIWRVEAQKFLTNVNLLEWSGTDPESIWARRQMTPEIADRLFTQMMTRVNSWKTEKDLQAREALFEACSKLSTCIVAKLKALPETLFEAPVIKPVAISLPDQPTAGPRWSAAQFLTVIGVHNEQLAAELSKFDARPERLKMLTVEQVVEFVGKYGCGPFDAVLVAQELSDRNMLK